MRNTELLTWWSLRYWSANPLHPLQNNIITETNHERSEMGTTNPASIMRVIIWREKGHIVCTAKDSNWIITPVERDLWFAMFLWIYSKRHWENSSHFAWSQSVSSYCYDQCFFQRLRRFFPSRISKWNCSVGDCLNWLSEETLCLIFRNLYWVERVRYLLWLTNVMKLRQKVRVRFFFVSGNQLLWCFFVRKPLPFIFFFVLIQFLKINR